MIGMLKFMDGRKHALCFSGYDAKDNFDHERWTNKSIAGIQPKPMLAYARIDFADFIPSNDSDNTIILNLRNSHNIYHTFPKIDRCCKLNEKNVLKYDGIDNMERIKCDIPQDEFTENYVNKREAIMMTGCQDKWKAKSWTIENLLNRYNYTQLKQNIIKPFIWPSAYQKNHETKTYYEDLSSNEVKNSINNGYLVRVFRNLPKGEIGWRYGKTEQKKYMLELMEEYAFPKPMPEDIFHEYHIDSDQAYLMLATAGTGTGYHLSP